MSQKPDFTILGMSIWAKPVAIASGERIVASFTIEHGALLVSSIKLVSSPDGTCRLSFAREGAIGRVVIKDTEARTALLQAAVERYQTRTSWRASAGRPFAMASHLVGNAS